MPFISGLKFWTLRELLRGTKMDLAEGLARVEVAEMSDYQETLIGVYQCPGCQTWVDDRCWYDGCPHCGIVGIDASKQGGQ